MHTQITRRKTSPIPGDLSGRIWRLTDCDIILSLSSPCRGVLTQFTEITEGWSRRHDNNRGSGPTPLTQEQDLNLNQMLNSPQLPKVLRGHSTVYATVRTDYTSIPPHSRDSSTFVMYGAAFLFQYLGELQCPLGEGQITDYWGNI